MPRALVYGVAISGTAVVRALAKRGYDIIAADDTVTDGKRTIAAELGVELFESPDAERIDALVRWCDLVAPAPGIAETHEVVAAAMRHHRPLRTEIDLAFEWEQHRLGGPRPMLAITGTDGKTTTTLLATEMLEAAGRHAVAVGNTDVPLVEALDDESVDVFVVECTSFRLSWTTCFRPNTAVWLNLAPDHLNWHTDMDSYIGAKARMWRFQRSDDTAIGFVADAIVMQHLCAAPSGHVTFGIDASDYHCADPDGTGAQLIGPLGPICAVSAMRRALPHDITNALAAAALVLESGLADIPAVAQALRAFVGPPHRIEPVGESAGVRWFNDSKATTPHAAITAIRAFDSLVLIAGGRNKGLDLGELASEPQRMRGVVAIGEAADLFAGLFDTICPVVRADSMADAVRAAAGLARPGDAVVLSPACASFDWYPEGGYTARGDDFRACVGAQLEQGAAAT